MPRLEDLDPESRQFLGAFQCRIENDVPFIRPGKPLAESRLAVITTSGLVRRSDKPFDLTNAGGDASFRIIPTDTDPSELTFSHVSTNWDRTGFAMDINVILPIDRLRELAKEGIIGSVAGAFYAFMGAIFRFDTLLKDSAPEVGRRLREDGVDIALLVPT